MKTKLQIINEVHDQWLESLVRLECEVRYFRLDGKEKDKNSAMIERDNIELRLSLLEQYRKELGG